MSDIERRRLDFRWIAEKRDALQLDYYAAFKTAYPEGSAISWMIGGRIHHGTVLRHGYSDRVEVRNDRTLAVRWIYAFAVREAMAPRGS